MKQVLLSAGDVYVVCHGSSDASILAECDQTFTYLSNGDDVFALTEVATGSILDIIGTIGPDPEVDGKLLVYQMQLRIILLLENHL